MKPNWRVSDHSLESIAAGTEDYDGEDVSCMASELWLLRAERAALQARLEAAERVVKSAIYAMRCGCFFPVPEPKPGATVDELKKWGAMRGFHSAIAAIAQERKP
jgi:hypothetical protein